MRLPFRHHQSAEPRLFTYAQLRFITNCAFDAGCRRGWSAAQELATAARRYRTYLILSELDALSETARRTKSADVADGVRLAHDYVRREFSGMTQQEAALLCAAGALPRRPPPIRA